MTMESDNQLRIWVNQWRKLATGETQVCHVYVLPNGQCMVFDQDGYSISILEGQWSEFRDLVESCASETTNWVWTPTPDTPPEPQNLEPLAMSTDPIECPTNVQGLPAIPEDDSPPGDAADDALVSRWILRQLRPSVRDSAREWRDRAVRRAVFGTIDAFLKKLDEEERICAIDRRPEGARDSIQALRREVNAMRDCYPTP